MKYYGQYCQCSNFDCDRSNTKLCGGTRKYNTIVQLLMWSYSQGQNGTKSIRDDLVSVIVIFIIDVYMRMEIATGLKSSRLLDRADYLQTGTNPERDECEHKYISDRYQLPLLQFCFGTTHARQSPVKNNKGS